MTILKNKFMLGAIAILVIGGIWYMMSPSSTSESTSAIVGHTATGDIVPSTGVGSPSNTSAQAGIPPALSDENLVQTLIAMQAIKLDGTIFSDPVFQSLKDFSTPIIAEPIGRNDPFAPLHTNTGTPPVSKSAVPVQSPHIFKQ